MTVQRIRKSTNLTQKEFSQHYRIPLQTLKQWEADENSSSYRRPPEHVVYMLRQLVMEDFDVAIGYMSMSEYIIEAAEVTRGDATHWFRYLGKLFTPEGVLKMTEAEIQDVLISRKVSMVQKVMFKEAVTAGTPTNLHTAGLNQKHRPKHVERLKQLIKEGKI